MTSVPILNGTSQQIIAGRFKLDNFIRRHHNVATYSGTELVSGKKIIAKVIENALLPTGLIDRLCHECEVLRTLQPIGGIAHLETDGRVAALITSFVEGVTLEDMLQQKIPTLLGGMEIAAAIIRDLDRVHEAGILHQDLKPSNIVIQKGDKLSARIIDFGFSRLSALNVGTKQITAGTAIYMSPEALGLTHSVVDERSDLYSLGIILYQLFSGHPPFQAEKVSDLLNQHLNATPPPISKDSSHYDVPPLLQALISKLLNKDPRERYQTAQAVVHDLTIISTNIERGISHPSMVLGATDVRTILSEPEFVGRDKEIAALNDSWRRAFELEPQLVMVEGLSGSGKSRLAEAFCDKLSDKDCWIIRGQGVDQSAQRPFHTLGGVIAALANRLERDPEFALGFKKRIGGYAASIASFLPELSPWLGDASVSSLGPDTLGENRYIHSMAMLFAGLGEVNRPALVIIDDCQWADELTTKLLQLWKTLEIPATPLIIMALFRSEEVLRDHYLRRSTPDLRLNLKPLDADCIRRFAESMSGPLPEDACRLVGELSGGSPFMASAVLRGLVESQILMHESGAWRLDQNALHRVQSSRRAAAFLARRLELLPDISREILTAAAVIGKEFAFSLIGPITGKSSREVVAAIADARRRGILWDRQGGSLLRFVHDKLREGLLATLDASTRKKIHAKIAAVSKARGETDPYFLAYHHYAAGHNAEAFPYAIEAADKARAVFSLDLAEQYFRIAADCFGDCRDEMRLRVMLGLGDVLMLRGSYDNAHEHLTHALGLAQTALDTAKVCAKIGELEFKRGDMAAAARRLENGLKALGLFVPENKWSLTTHLTFEIFLQFLHSVFPKVFLHKKKQAPSVLTKTISMLYSRMAYAYWFSRGKWYCAWAHLKNMNLMESYMPTAELAQVYSEHGPVMTMLPYFSRGLQYIEKSLNIRRELGDLWGQGQSLNFKGVVLYSASRFSEAKAIFSEAVSILDRTGDQWERNTANWHIVYCLYRLGDYEAAVDLAKKVYHAAESISDRSSAGIVLAAWAKASKGEVPADYIKRESGFDSADVHTRAELMQATALRHLSLKEYSEAKQALYSGIKMVEEASLRQEYVAPLWSWLTTVLRTEYHSLSLRDFGKGKRLLKEAMVASRMALKIARSYRNNLPHALREAAYIAAAKGQFRKAVKFIQESVKEAEKQEAFAEQQLSNIALREIDVNAKWQESLDGVSSVDFQPIGHGLPGVLNPELRNSRPAEPDSRVTLAIVNRFEALVTGGRKIASALNDSDVYNALVKLSNELFHCQSCVLGFSSEHEMDPIVVHSSHNMQFFSKAVATKALKQRSTTIFMDQIDADASDSILISDARSILCAPILVNDRCEKLLYLQHNKTGQIFAGDDVKLIEFITTLAGASLETIATYEKLRSLSAEQRDQMEALARTQAELQQAWRTAEAASSAKSEFLAKVSHELRTPLGAIMGFTELLMEPGVEVDEVQTYLGIIRNNSAKLLEIINDILDLSKVEAGKMELHPEVFDLRSEIKDVIALLGKNAESKGVRLTWQIAENVPALVLSDSLRVRQILTNLLGNAIKFTEQGEVNVNVRYKQSGPKAKPHEIEVLIKDEGPGIPEDKFATLFAPFAQVDNSYARAFGGTGLGLSLSRQLATLLGGDVYLVSSEPGRGSIFAFTFSAKGGAELQNEGALKKFRLGEGSFQPLQHRRILFVEDNLDNQVYYRHVLERYGASIDVASNGVEGIEMATRNPYDLILMDMLLPEMDGYEATRHLRQIGYKTPIVALTAHAMADDKTKCLAIGCNAYLAKPVTGLDLVRELQAVCMEGSTNFAQLH